MTNTKEKMIEALIHDDLTDWNSESDKNYYFSMLLADGFTGYKNLSKTELAWEIAERELVEIRPNPDCKQCDVPNGYTCSFCEHDQIEEHFEGEISSLRFYFDNL